MRRYDFGALLAALRCDESAAKARLGLDHRQVTRYATAGLREHRADELAVKAGLHPAAVWPDFGHRECVECGSLFPPSRKGHDFCNERCFQRRYQRGDMRRRYQTDPEYRERKLAAQRRYRETSKKALAKKQRAWKDANADRQREYRRAYYLANRERLLAKQREYDARKRQEGAA